MTEPAVMKLQVLQMTGVEDEGLERARKIYDWLIDKPELAEAIALHPKTFDELGLDDVTGERKQYLDLAKTDEFAVEAGRRTQERAYVEGEELFRDTPLISPIHVLERRSLLRQLIYEKAKSLGISLSVGQFGDLVDEIEALYT